MALGAYDVLGKRLASAFVVTKRGHGGNLARPGLTLVEAGHPEPDAASLEAGHELLAFIENLPPKLPVLFLISGGASALLEVLPEGIELADLQRVNRWLLGSGLPIQRMNQVRKNLSEIKGGRLAMLLPARPVLNLMISDVPGDDPATIGSGLLVPQSELGPLTTDLPDWVQSLLERSPTAPPAGHPCFSRIRSVIVLTNREAREAAAQAGEQLGLTAHRHPQLLEGEAEKVTEQLAKQVIEGAPGFYVWGGETTVTLPPEPGQGGRCQSMALSFARRIEGRSDIFLLCGGTDGSDGPGEDAGALVDGGTVRRGVEEGLDPEICLARADSGHFLEASGDLIQTGPTGSNVMDLVLALKTS